MIFYRKVHKPYKIRICRAGLIVLQVHRKHYDLEVKIFPECSITNDELIDFLAGRYSTVGNNNMEKYILKN